MQIVYLILTFLLLRTSAVPLRLQRDTPLEDEIGLMEDGKIVTAKVNDFLDRIQPRISGFIVKSNLEPLGVNDVVSDFWVIPPIIPIIQHRGTLALTSGRLNNLSTIERQGNSIATYKNKKLELDMVLGFDIIYLSYDFFAKVLLINHYGDFDVMGKTVHARVKMVMDFENYEISLKQLTLGEIESIAIAFRGSILVRWLVTPIANVIMPIFKNTLAKSIEGKVAAEIEKYLLEINDNLRRTRTVLADEGKLA